MSINNRERAARLAEASTHNVPDGCQLWTRTQFNAPSAGDQDHDGDADAVDGWKSEPVSARHHDRTPPRGVPVAWGGGSHGHGHRAISLGGGKIRTTDGAGRGVVATRNLDWPEREWGLAYLGWSETIDGHKIPVPVMTRGTLVDRSIASLTKAHAKAKSKRRRRLIASSIAALKKIQRSSKR
jgi:hypothetical protein